MTRTSQWVNNTEMYRTQISVWWHGDPNRPCGLIQTWGCRSHKPGSVTHSHETSQILDINPIENQFVFIPAKDPIPYPILYPILSFILSHVPYPILSYPVSHPISYPIPYPIPSHILSHPISYPIPYPILSYPIPYPIRFHILSCILLCKEFIYKKGWIQT
jgi:hypothetical protein